jgi:hypothetical protein
MDPQTVSTIALMLGVAHASKDVVSDIGKRLLGPFADRAGDKLADHFFKKHSDNATATLVSAAEMLSSAALEIQPVPGRILIPLLQAASLEDDEMLRQKWAALLANAASSTDANKILPAFSEILRQLTPVQAQILDWLFEKASDGGIGFLVWPDVARAEIETHFHLSHDDYALFVSDMDRLQVLEGRRDTKVPAHLSMSTEQMQALIIGRWDSREKYNFVTLTTLGLRFMFACMSPTKVQEIRARVHAR